MSKEESLYDLNDDEMVENQQSGVKVTAEVLKGYILNGKKNKYDGDWYLVENKKFNLFENVVKESINQLNEYVKGNDNNVEVVTYEKDKRVTEKKKMRVTYHGGMDFYDGLTTGRAYEVVSENEEQYILNNDLGGVSEINKNKFKVE